jgi:hypothetical protein
MVSEDTTLQTGTPTPYGGVNRIRFIGFSSMESQRLLFLNKRQLPCRKEQRYSYIVITASAKTTYFSETRLNDEYT